MVKYHNKTKTGAISEMNGAKIAVKCLAEQGVTQVFAYPGASVLPLLSAIDAEKRISVCMNTHEQFCAFAADGYARASGRVGVCIATSGPGATNLVTGIADAYMDSIPLVAITGNVPLSLLGTDAFQEIDIAGVTMPITKHNFIVKSVEALAPTLREAFRIASEGRKGPVLVDIPSDIFTSESKYIRAEAAAAAPAAEKSFPNLISVAGLINKSERPVICVGGGVIASGASARIKELADILSCPVVSTAMGIGGFDGTDTRYCGVTGMDNEPYTLKPISECDLFIAVGVRFSERMISPLRSRGDVRVVHIDIDDAEIDKNLSPCGSLIGDASEVLERLCPLLERRSGWYGFSLHERVKSVYSLISDILPDAVYTTEVGMHQVAACRSYILRLRIPVGRARIPGHRCDPVGHDDALVAVLGAENVHNQTEIFRRVGAVQQIVGGHNGLGLGFPHADAEALQVDFTHLPSLNLHWFPSVLCVLPLSYHGFGGQNGTGFWTQKHPAGKEA